MSYIVSVSQMEIVLSLLKFIINCLLKQQNIQQFMGNFIQDTSLSLLQRLAVEMVLYSVL